MNKNVTRREFVKKSFIIGGVGIITPTLIINDYLDSNSLNIKETNINNDCFIKWIRKGRKILNRIIAVGDPHWGDDHISTTHPRLGKYANNIHYKERFDRMISWLNIEQQSEDTDFIVFNGDIATNRPEYLPIVKEQFEKLKIHYYVVHGNHDHSSEDNWKNLWGYGRNHCFTIGDYAIILLNSANENGDYECADKEWLEVKLKEFKDKTGILIFCHIFQHDGNFMWAGINCPSITDVLVNFKNVKMVIYSHNHLVDGHYAIKKDNLKLNTFFTGHFSSWGLPYLSYRVIEIYGDNNIGTYVYNPAEQKIINYDLL